jgi:hypothetical protein
MEKKPQLRRSKKTMTPEEIAAMKNFEAQQLWFSQWRFNAYTAWFEMEKDRVQRLKEYRVVI